VQTVAEARASGSSQVIIDAPVPRLLASGAISPNYSRIAVLVTPWPKQRGRQKLDKAQRVEIARVRAMVAPDLLILRGAAWIGPGEGRVQQLQRLRVPWVDRLQAKRLRIEL